MEVCRIVVSLSPGDGFIDLSKFWYDGVLPLTFYVLFITSFKLQGQVKGQVEKDVCVCVLLLLFLLLLLLKAVADNCCSFALFTCCGLLAARDTMCQG